MSKKFSESGQKIRIFLTMSWGVRPSMNLLASLEAGLFTLLGNAAESCKESADELTIFDHESLLCEILGLVKKDFLFFLIFIR